ncbi:MAG: glutathione peroxidase [Flavobacteriales bacterium CG_4_9_14_0_2_um_filter_35_242]|nr:glutathione peroxidase [Zetaproteobacteria bacterium]NDK18853.1 glutathione peroxidase [Flavobacteriales bacterium]OIO09304.1 MAG: glutathione peroxidase [Flavobacteriaceae bacterium CG1_02_35_72]PIR14212.1 MAG: glutathione peroxidase [Flavobacteriales bacterium CG11_big_fil_rev_8_21_14_0_20_35_7]PIV17345.1 MAG: glutathione peroxidase [Flavobacteriales bacterium CG03_land_8_20_14_0_80_35_15]PIX06537.1 MAG: glutathione peroxidase [Flavobacteriales bacterium CG_4_8_14_3_um_filter_35_10]PJA05
MKKLLVLLLITSSVFSQNTKKVVVSANLKNQTHVMKKETIYHFKMTDLYGKEFKFSKLKGKKIMIVNTASKCGYTPQYKDLEQLYKTYKDKNFVIIGFPANNFGQQEPGSNTEIAEFCQQNYGVSFPMMEKTSVKGDDMNPIYQFLTKQSKNGYKDSEVAWNFQKYLIDENGFLVNVYPSKVLPTDAAITAWIENK